MVFNAPIRVARGDRQDRDRTHFVPLMYGCRASQLPYQCHHGIGKVWWSCESRSRACGVVTSDVVKPMPVGKAVGVVHWQQVDLIWNVVGSAPLVLYTIVRAPRVRR